MSPLLPMLGLPQDRPRCSCLLDVPLVVAITHIRGQALEVFRDVGLDLAVSEEGEAVGVPIADVVVFEAGLLDRLEEVDRLRTDKC